MIAALLNFLLLRSTIFCTSFPALDFPKNIYMVHPDLICIFNTVTSEGKSEDSAVVKKCESSEVSVLFFFCVEYLDAYLETSIVGPP